jgi:hypothetical protein
LQNKILTQNLAKNIILKTEDNVPAGKVTRKNMKKKNKFFYILKVTEERTGPDPETSVRGTDPGIGISTKISRIPNNVWNNIPADIKITTNL